MPKPSNGELTYQALLTGPPGPGRDRRIVKEMEQALHRINLLNSFLEKPKILIEHCKTLKLAVAGHIVPENTQVKRRAGRKPKPPVDPEPAPAEEKAPPARKVMTYSKPLPVTEPEKVTGAMPSPVCPTPASEIVPDMTISDADCFAPSPPKTKKGRVKKEVTKELRALRRSLQVKIRAFDDSDPKVVIENIGLQLARLLDARPDGLMRNPILDELECYPSVLNEYLKPPYFQCNPKKFTWTLAPEGREHYLPGKPIMGQIRKSYA